jgi:hypothetical protein
VLSIASPMKRLPLRTGIKNDVRGIAAARSVEVSVALP